MSTELIEQEYSIEPITFPIIAARVEELGAEDRALTVTGINDKAGLTKVHSARIAIKNMRVAVEKRRKELKAASLDYGRRVDSAAKQITDALSPIELHLENQESAIAEEKARLRRIEEEARAKALQSRLDALAAVGCIANPLVIAQDTEAGFTERLAKAAAEHAEKLRKEEEAAEAKRKADAEEAKQRALEAAERERQAAELKAERERLDAIRKQQESEAAKLKADRDKIEAEAREAQRQKELEAAKIAAAAKAAEETKLAIAAKIATDKAEAEAKEAARIKAEQERPYREQLQALADAILALNVPTGPMLDQVRSVLRNASQAIRRISENKFD